MKESSQEDQRVADEFECLLNTYITLVHAWQYHNLGCTMLKNAFYMCHFHYLYGIIIVIISQLLIIRRLFIIS